MDSSVGIGQSAKLKALSFFGTALLIIQSKLEMGDGKNLMFRTTTLIDDIVSVSERHIALVDEDRAREILSIVEDELPEGFSFGGMSGCPAFVNRNATLEFAGIVYESSDDPSGIFYISHADLITAEGKIDWGRFPH